MTTPQLAADEQAEWLSIDGYAAKLRVGRATIRNAVTARKIHFHRVGRHVRFSPEDEAANAAMWAQQPIHTPAATVIRIGPRATRRRTA